MRRATGGKPRVDRLPCVRELRVASHASAVARELDLVPSALCQWVKRAQADRSKGRTGLTTAEREELVRLRKALRIAEEERDILKKATAFFAKQSR
jgi:transposase